jgi:CPA2 family monovalent cation:H+ antiporter-2
VVVRAGDEADLEKLAQAGAAEVVPEAFEASIMLASHALALIGVPLPRVVRRIREIRSQRYAPDARLLPGLLGTPSQLANAETRLFKGL